MGELHKIHPAPHVISLSRYSDTLRAGRLGDRIPLGLNTTPALGPAQPHVQSLLPLFPGVRQWKGGVDHPLHLAPRLKKE